jgi:hypothetical protein
MLLSTRILRELRGIPCKRCASTALRLTIAGERIAAVEAVADAERVGQFELEVL